MQNSSAGSPIHTFSIPTPLCQPTSQLSPWLWFVLVQIDIADKDFPFSRYVPPRKMRNIVLLISGLLRGQVKVKEDIEGGVNWGSGCSSFKARVQWRHLLAPLSQFATRVVLLEWHFWCIYSTLQAPPLSRGGIFPILCHHNGGGHTHSHKSPNFLRKGSKPEVPRIFQWGEPT